MRKDRERYRRDRQNESNMNADYSRVKRTRRRWTRTTREVKRNNGEKKDERRINEARKGKEIGVDQNGPRRREKKGRVRAKMTKRSAIINLPCGGWRNEKNRRKNSTDGSRKKKGKAKKQQRLSNCRG